MAAVEDAEALPALEQVEAELCTLAGQIAAATCRFLVLLGDFDAREGWAGWNVRSCAQWLSWRCGLDLRTAREYVRVARALRELPVTRDAFAAGRVSYSKARAISRVATPHTEADLVDAALHAPASQIERLTRGLKTVERIAASDAAAARGERPTAEPSLRWQWEDDGTLSVWGRLPAEQGAALLAALSRAEEVRTGRGSAEPPDQADGSSAAAVPRNRGDVNPRPPANAAPALVTMAAMVRDQVPAPRHAPVADVVVHVAAATVAQKGASGEALPGLRLVGGRLDEGPVLDRSVLDRLVCDARIRVTVYGSDGRTLDMGRHRRRPTAAQKTALWHRDRGCAVPGCTRTRFLHAHHVRPWSRGGATSLDNLVLLCGEHHRALHDGGFSVVALGRQRFRFHGPGGAHYPEAPPIRGTAGGVTAAFDTIGPQTIEPDWAGHDLDLHHAVATYLQSWELAAQRRG